MTELLARAFTEAQKAPPEIQDAIAEQVLAALEEARHKHPSSTEQPDETPRERFEEKASRESAPVDTDACDPQGPVPGIRVQYADLEMAFDFVSSERKWINFAYVSRATGQFYYVSDDIDQEIKEEVPEDVEDPDRYTALPHKNDLDLGVVLVRSFVEQYLPKMARVVERLFSSRGAYGRFKDLLESEGLLDTWHRYEQDRTRAALKAWCAENGIDVVE